MNEIIVKTSTDINISYLIEAANDVLVRSKEDISYFESLKNKKWYQYIFEKITFKKDNEIRKANGVLNLAKMQDIIIKILFQLVESRNEIYEYVENNASLIEQLSRSNLYIQEQQKAIITVLRQLKNKESSIPKYQDITSENANTIFCILRKFAQGKEIIEKKNEMTQQYLRALTMANTVNADYDFENLDVIENMSLKIRQRLAIMLYEYMYLSDVDDTIKSEILDRISPNTKKAAKEIVYKNTQLMGKEIIIQQYQKNETMDTVTDDGIIYSHLNGQEKECIKYIDVSSLDESICVLLVGRSGSGKTTLLQTIAERISTSLKTDEKENGYMICTDSTRKFTIIDLNGSIYVDEGIMLELDSIIQKQHVNRLIVCINFALNRFEEYEANLIISLKKNNPNLKVIVALTQCYNTKSADFKRMITYIKDKTNQDIIIPVLCVDWETDGGIKKSFGVNDLIGEVINE